MPKNVQTARKLHSLQMLPRLCSKSCKLAFSSVWTESFQMWKLLSCVLFFATPWTVAHQAPLSREFSRQEYTEKLYKKYLNDPDNHLEPDIPEWEVKWALGSITMSKASGGDGIPAELFQILKDDAVKVLHSICQQIWKTQQWPQDWKRSVFIPILKKGKGNVKLVNKCTLLTR